MKDLELVERVQVRLGHKVKIWHLNLTGKSQKTLEMMVFKDLLKETRYFLISSGLLNYNEPQMNANERRFRMQYPHLSAFIRG